MADPKAFDNWDPNADASKPKDQSGEPGAFDKWVGSIEYAAPPEPPKPGLLKRAGLAIVEAAKNEPRPRPTAPGQRRGGTATEFRATLKPPMYEDTPLPVSTAQPGDTILDKPATRDPLIDPEYVRAQRNQYAAIPEADRLGILQEAAKLPGVQGRAARLILADVTAENAGADRARQDRPGLVNLLAGAESGGKRGDTQVHMPDLRPTITELVDNPSLPMDDRSPQRLAAASRLQAAARAAYNVDSGMDAIADRADRASRDFRAEAFAKANPKLAALASGGGRMVAGLFNAVPVIMDFASKLVDKDSTRAPNAFGVDDIMRTANSLMPEVGKQDMGKAWEKGEFGGWLATNLIAQAPQMAGSVLSAMFPPLRAVLLPGMGAMSAGQAYAEGDSSAAAVLKGAAEIIGEKASLGMFDKAREALSKLPRPLRGEFLQSLGRSLALRGGAVGGQLITGAIEEGVTQVLQNGVDKVVEGKRKDLLDGVLQAMVLGAAMEGPMVVPHAMRNLLPQSKEQVFADALASDAEQRAPTLQSYFTVSPTTPTAPTEVRTATLKRFDELAATFGLSPKVAAAIRDKAGELPAESVPGFLQRATDASNKRGMFQRPVDDAGVAQLQATLDAQTAQDAGPGDSTRPAEASTDFTGLDEQPAIPGPDAPTIAAGSQQGGANGDQAQEAAQEGLVSPVEGEKINRKWSAFSPESGTLGIPREQMPQIAAEHRGALVNFMNARGIEHRMEVVDPTTLKPTQGEFEPKKVAAIAEKPSGRSLLVSQDGYILDGHHQWLAARESGSPIRVVRLDAPINDLLRLAHQFPSSTTSKGPRRTTDEAAPAAGSDLADPAVAPVAAAAAGGDQPGRGEATPGPVSDAPTNVVHSPAAPDAGAAQDGLVGESPSTADQALKRLEDLRQQRAAAMAAGNIEEVNRLNLQVAQVRGDLTAAKAQERTEAPVPEAKPPAPAPTTSRVIGKYGRTPKAAVDIALRQNDDGTLTPYSGKYAMVDYESGEPIVLPANVTDAQAAEAIRKAGAIGQKDRFYGVKTDEDTNAAGQEQQPAADAETAAAPEPAAPAGPSPEEVAAARTKRMDGLKALLHCLQT